jgi:hypothetical protein
MGIQSLWFVQWSETKLGIGASLRAAIMVSQDGTILAYCGAGTGPTPARNRARHRKSLAYESRLRFSSQIILHS